MSLNPPWWVEELGPRPEWQALWEKTVSRFHRLACLTVGDETWTYHCLNDRARRISGYLADMRGWKDFPFVALGVGGGEYLAWAVGTWLAGGTIVPFCPRSIGEDKRLRESVFGKAGFLVQGLLSDTAEKLETKGANFRELARRSPPGWHGIYFTSGSTGVPRAVVRGWKQAYFEAQSYAQLLGLSERDRCASFIQPFFGASTKQLLGCLLAGCHQWWGQPGECPPSGRVLYATPSQVQGMAEKPASHAGFEWISLTGEAPTAENWPIFARWAAPGGKVLNALGGTEFGVAAIQIKTAFEPYGPFSGKPVAGKELHLVAESGATSLPGEMGLLHVASDYLAEGYLDPAEGDDFEIKDFDKRNGVMTGDVARLDVAGKLEIAGRAGRMVKRGGKWLDTEPLASFLTHHVAVQNFALEKIGDMRESTAWLVGRPDRKLDLAGLRREMVAHLRDRYLVPARLVSVMSLPHNRHGKADPAALSDVKNSHLVLETNRDVERLEQIARRVAERLSVRSGFCTRPVLEAGESLDSLEWHELAVAVEKITGKPLSVADLLALNRAEDSVFGKERAGITGLRIFGEYPKPVGCHGILWFGDGIGAVVEKVGRRTPVWHWDCDRCLNNPVIWGQATIQSMARDFLGQAGLLPPVLRVGGFSLGALLAFEATRLLVARGSNVEACIMVDPPEPRGILTGALNHLAASCLLMGLDRLMRGIGFSPGPALARRIRRAFRRLALLCYRGGEATAPTHLFSSERNRGAASVLIDGDFSQVQHVALDVWGHVECVRDASAVRLWTRCLERQKPSQSLRAWKRTA